MYVQMLNEICTWLYALDGIHYSHWLPSKHLSSYLNGTLKFNRHLRMAISSAKKRMLTSLQCLMISSVIQNNKVIKSEGGAINVLHNETALPKWMVVSTEISRTIEEFERA